jgi:hypothetical protein
MSFPQATTLLLLIRYRVTLLSTLLHVRQYHTSLRFIGAQLSTLLQLSLITISPTIGLVPISFNGYLLSRLLRVSLIATRHSTPVHITYRGPPLSTILPVNLKSKTQQMPCTYQLRKRYCALYHI